MSNLSTCVIYNPRAGRGRAKQLLDSTVKWACPEAVVRPTQAPRHATELAKQAAEEGFERVIAAGGDGTVHEVANGLMQAKRPAVRLGVWPLGSSNDYAHTLGLDPWWKAGGKGYALRSVAVDIGHITGTNREVYYANCAGVGFNGMVALESRSIGWLRGMPLYALAFLMAMVKHFRTPELHVQLAESDYRKPTLALTINLGIREGGFPITKMASLTDQKFDGLHVANVSRWDLIRFLPGLMSGNLPTNHPKLSRFSTGRVVVRADHALCIHADGEFFCKPTDEITTATFDILPAALFVECLV
jgi:diacylglycerol kinase (ATP)